MTRHTLLRTGSILVLHAAALADAEVLVSIATPDGVPESGFQAGDLLTLPVTVQGDLIAGLCAIDFDLACSQLRRRADRVGGLSSGVLAGHPGRHHTASGACVPYSADAAINGYALAVISNSPSQVLSQASAPSGGVWAAAQHFTTLDLCGTLGQPVPAPEYGEDLYLCDTVTGDVAGSGAADGHLLDFTPQATGALILHLSVWSADESGAYVVEGQAEITLQAE